MKRLTSEEKQFIIQNQSLSLDKLSARLARPKTTIYFHLRKLRGPLGPTTEKKKKKKLRKARKLNQSAASKARRTKAARVAANAMHMQKRAEATRLAKYVWQTYKGIPDFLLGLTMYWCEGTKRNLQFTNSDPAMIRFMLKWVRQYIPYSEIKWELRGPSEEHQKRIEAFWKTEVSDIEDYRWYVINMRKPDGLALLSLRTDYRQSTFIKLLLQYLAEHLDPRNNNG